MKEIIYLDTNMINSALSQLDYGITQSFGMERKKEFEEGIIDTNSTMNGSEVGGKGKFSSVILGAETVSKFSEENLEGYEESETLLEGQKEFLNRAFHDFSLDLLIKKLQERNLLKYDLEECKPGDFYLHQSEQFKIYNFEVLRRMVDSEIVEGLLSINLNQYKEELKDLEKKHPKKGRKQEVILEIERLKSIIKKEESDKKSSEHGFNMARLISNFGYSAFPNTTLLISGDTISLLDNHFLRLPNISVLPTHVRKHKILCRVHMKKEKTTSATQVSQGDNPAQVLEEIPKLLTGILLDSFGITQVDDFFVTPFAVYYEE